jgi:formate hydrogenlyase subunit 4
MLIMGYILALVRAGLCLAGLDSGAGFAALGSSRELYYYVLTEIGFLLVSTALLFCWRTSAIVELDALHSSYQIYFVWGARECPAACGVATSGSGARIGTRSR